MKKISLFLLALICSVTTWAGVDVAIDRTSWSVTGTAAPTSAIEGANDGRVTAMLDGKNNTFFHSDWSGTNPPGAGCPLAFQIDMAEEQTLTKVTLLPRQDADAGAPTTWRIYVSNTSTDLSTMSAQSDRTTGLSEETLTSTLGAATLSGTWTYSTGKEEQTATFTTPVTGRYILFVADDTRASDKNWLCVAEFNAYKEQASVSYTVSGGSVVYDGTTYADGETITLSDNIDESKLSAAPVEGKTGSVSVSGTTITVSYYNTFVAPTITTGYVPSVSTTTATAIETGKFYVIKGYDQNNQVATGYLYNNSGSVAANATLTANNNYVWYAFNASGDNFYLYNMEAQKFIKLGTSNNGGVTLVSDDAFVQFTAGTGVFAIKNSTCDQWIDFGNSGLNPNTWEGGCSGSRRAAFYEVEYVDPAAAAKAVLATAIETAKATVGTNPGWKAASDIDPLVATAQTVYDNTSATEAEVTAATTALNNGVAAASYIMPSADKTYQVISAMPGFETQQSVKKAMYANGTTMSWTTLDDNNAAMFWHFTTSGDDYTMKNNFTSCYPGVQATQSAAYPTSSEAIVVTLTALGQGQFNLITTGSGYAMHTGGHSSGAGVSGNIVAWNGGASTGSAWYIVETSADETAAAKTTFKTLQGHTPFNVAADEEVVKADEIDDITTTDAAINAVNAIDPETATVAEMGACYAANAATIKKLTAYGTLTNIAYTFKPGYNTICLPCWGKASTTDYQAYTCAAVDGNVLTLTEVATTAPKTPFIILNKTDNNMKIRFIGWNKVTDATTTFTSGLLTGCVAATPITEGYVLSADANSFDKVTEETNVAQYNCYLASSEAVTLSEDKYYFEAQELIVNRETPTAKYGTICLPYDATVEGAVLLSLTSGVKDGADLKSVSFDLVEENTIKAGVPYLYRAEADAQTFTCDVKSTKKAASEVNGLVGTLEKTEIAAGSYIFYTPAGGEQKICKVTNVDDKDYTNVYSGQYKAYINPENIPEAQEARGAATFFVYTDEATGIQSIDFQNAVLNNGKYIQNGRVVIVKNGQKFNTAGQLVK